MGKASGNTWLSAPASTTATNSTTFTVPLPNWRSTMTIGTTPTYDIGEYTVTLKRELAVYWTEQGSQSPFVIARGTLDCTGTMKFTVPSDEDALDLMLNDTQPPCNISATNGFGGGSAITYTISINQAAFIKAKPVRSGVLVGYDTEYRTEANTVNTGGSGGLGQVTITVQNEMPTY